MDGNCTSPEGNCTCNMGYEGEKCDECSSGYYQNDTTPITCDGKFKINKLRVINNMHNVILKVLQINKKIHEKINEFLNLPLSY